MSYDPTIGRWTQEDPIAFAGGDANLYRYVGNSPTNAVDPTGLISIYFDGTGQELGANTIIQTLFAYSNDPNNYLYLNPEFVDDHLVRDSIINSAIEKIVLAQSKIPTKKFICMAGPEADARR